MKYHGGNGGGGVNSPYTNILSSNNNSYNAN